MENIIKYLPWLYLAAISLISVIVTCYDKIAAKKFPKHRTREKTLFLLSALGGSVAMFVTMQMIRHKTKHRSFMIGIPMIMIAQAALVYAIFYFL
ncbi:MAG: DUF1294 domain-containing protein [Clostridia bacterium]|jgi:uncharacterized membrane protein YsdA (DUF1294 family)|nr:DUF1294 domain-containing protein [Clostridia bacterium]